MSRHNYFELLYIHSGEVVYQVQGTTKRLEPGDFTGEDVEYLMPFLAQDAGFPHVVSARTGIPAQVFDLMRRRAN